MSRKQKERVRLTALNIFFIVLCFITLIPILYSLSVSLNGQNTLLSSDFSFIPKNFSLENYRRVLFGEDILTWLGNSVYLAVVTVSLSLCVAIPAAYCFSRRRFPGRRPIFEVPCALNSFPAVLSMFAVYRLLRPMGLINHRTGLILIYTGTMAVFSLWNIKGYFDTVPVEIEEAARMDGANPLQVVTRIVFAFGEAQYRCHSSDGPDLCVERVYLCYNLYDRRGELHTGCRTVCVASNGNERQLARFLPPRPLQYQFRC